MRDPDELDRLRRADPLAGSPAPSADSPEARALFEEITMVQPSGVEAQAREERRRMGLVAAAAALVVLVAGVGFALARGDGGEDSEGAAGTATTQVPVSPGGVSSASCVEVYDPSTLARRQVAFDGTVAQVAGDTVTFTVTRWYRGGSGPSATLQGSAGLSGLTSAGPSTGLTPGTRLLVAGDGGFAWACGFTQPYEPAVAAEWARAFGP